MGNCNQLQLSLLFDHSNPHHLFSEDVALPGNSGPRQGTDYSPTFLTYQSSICAPMPMRLRPLEICPDRYRRPPVPQNEAKRKETLATKLEDDSPDLVDGPSAPRRN